MKRSLPLVVFLLVGTESEFHRHQEILCAKVVDPDTAGAKFTQGLEKNWNAGGGLYSDPLSPQ